MTRDTDHDWTVIARHHPFFGVLTNEQYLTPNLTPAAIDEFYATGNGDIEHVARTLERLTGVAFAPETALDFGCGVGRLSFAMRAFAAQVIGVDVAPDMLRVGKEQAAARGVTDVEFRDTLPDERVDWVNSLIVLQHIPPERGYGLLERLVALVNPGGAFSVQVSFFHDTRHTGEITRDLGDYRYDGRTIELIGGQNDYPEGAMSMYDYDLNRVLRTLYLGGITSVLAQHTDHAGCHGAWLFGQKVS